MGALCNLSEEEQEDEGAVFAAIYDKYEIDEDNFAALISDLLPLIQFGKSFLRDNTLYKGFGKQDGKLTEMFVKMEIAETP